MTKPFRGCRYEVHVYAPAREIAGLAQVARVLLCANKGLWSRHSSLVSAQRSFREAVNNRRGDHATGTLVELCDVDGNVLLEREAARA